MTGVVVQLFEPIVFVNLIVIPVIVAIPWLAPLGDNPR
jgi:hypothetical protein